MPGAAAGSPRRSRRPGTRTTTPGSSRSRRSTGPASPSPTGSAARRRWSSRWARESGRRRRRWPPRIPRSTCWHWRSGCPASLRVWAGSPRPARPTCGSAPSTPPGRSSTCSRPAGLAGLWTFFPDPWPKTRHHKRRLVDPAFAALAADRLAPGATWRLATDWADYAQVMRDVLDAQPLLEGGLVDRWAERPVTKFERKGVAGGPDDHRPGVHPTRLTARRADLRAAARARTPPARGRPRPGRARRRARVRAAAPAAGG